MRTATNCSNREVETAVAAYRDRLRDAGDVSASSLDEIEDHMREIIAELRDSGMPLALAIREAAERMGDPTAIAREHGRVETSFGARLPAWRAWIAAAVIMVAVAALLRTELQLGGDAMSFVKFLPLVICVAGLAKRATWARMLLLAQLVWWFTNGAVMYALGAQMLVSLPWLPCAAVAMALLLPWGRREITLPGTALSFAYLGFEVMSREFMEVDRLIAMPHQVAAGWFSPGESQPTLITVIHHAPLITHGVLVAGLVASIVGIVAVVVRSRWAAVPLAFASATTALVFECYLRMGGWHFYSPAIFGVWQNGRIIASATATFVAAVIAWRTAPRRFNSFFWRTA
ncbi:MAG TPA: permease prefix domain 1-containing protein [Kofleriaceae bacterium]